MPGERFNGQGPLGREGGGPSDTGVAGPSQLSATSATMGVAMVGLLGGGPRLEMRAARVVLTDGYGAPSRSRDGRLRGLIRHRGD